jgi:hypothetical protein
MASHDVMIFDCHATKHCTPDASKLSKVTDANPRHAVRVGDGERLDFSVIGEMRTNIRSPDNTVTPVTCKKKTSLRHAVETMHLTNVLVVPEMKCNLFSCASAYKNDGIQTHLNAPSEKYSVLSNHCIKIPSSNKSNVFSHQTRPCKCVYMLDVYTP